MPLRYIMLLVNENIICTHIRNPVPILYPPQSLLSSQVTFVFGQKKKIFTPPTFRFCPSKGKQPLTRVYKMTPRLQMSTSGPSYFFPWKSSGAAYGGEPQNVSSLLPAENSLLNPKSAILMLESASRSRFSACTKHHGNNKMKYKQWKKCKLSGLCL